MNILYVVLIIVLVLALLGGIPSGGYGFPIVTYPVGIILIILLILLLL